MTIVLGILGWLWNGLWGLATNPKSLAIAGIMAFLAYQTGHWRGDNHRNAVWVQKIEAEREKQEQTVARSELKALGEITRLNAEVEERDAQITVLMAEADSDPNANRPAIGIDGVRRLNKIAPRRPK